MMVNKIKEKAKTLNFWFVSISIILFIASLFFPAFFIDREDSDAYSNSLFLLGLGWMSFLGGGFIPTLIWLANPLYFLSLLLISQSVKWGIIPISISVILALFFSNLDFILSSENGAMSRITELGSGFFLWLSSFLVLMIASIMTFFKKVQPSHFS